MIIEVKRLIFTEKTTIGELRIDGKKYCYTLEDRYRGNTPKVYGETCIPCGEYKITLRREGTMYEDYKKRFKFFDGSLNIIDVPNYKYILIHIGNYPKDTLGCLLVGMSAERDAIKDSTKAFALIYPIIYNAINKGEEVKIKIFNEVI